ncbi:MAG: hypothetical protein WC149_09575 [Arcobacteraceae bacterium]
MQLIFQALVVIAIVAGYFLIDFNALYQKLQGEASFVVQNQECDLKQSSCVVTIEDGTVLEFEIVQKDIPLMKPLDFKLKSSNPNLENITLKLYATNMMMGTYELKFTPDGKGNYTAKGTLPTCPVGGMKWNADVQVHKLGKIIGARFLFETDI